MDYSDFCELRGRTRSTSRSSISSSSTSSSTSSRTQSESALPDCDHSESSSCSSGGSGFFSSKDGTNAPKQRVSLAAIAGRRPARTSTLGGRKSYLNRNNRRRDTTASSNRRNFISDRLSSIVDDGADDALALLVAREFDQMEI